MSISEQNSKLKLNALSDRVDELISFYKQDLDFYQMVYSYWTAKDVLGHLTFWHESFAKNLHDLVNGIKPNPLKGKLSEVNRMSVETTSDISIEVLIKRLQIAQNTIDQNIGNILVESIPYKKGSRNYSRIEHLEIVERHIRTHLKDLNIKIKS